MKKLLLSCLLIINTGFVLADEPPDWQAFLIHSANNQWVAYVAPGNESENNSKEPWKDKWQLQVFNNLRGFPVDEEKAVWSAEFQPTGYPEGLLSDDGQVFAQISFWYQHKFPLITIYRKECKQEYYANKLALPKNMPASTSHQIWLDQKKNNRFVDTEGQFKLQVFTLVGERFISTECKSD